MEPQDKCIFCKIVRGDAPAARVWEDEQTLVFMDVAPSAPGHTLVIPKLHYENVFEMNEEAMMAVAGVTRRVARAIRVAFGPEGLGIFQLNGKAAGQTVFHYHAHLIPRAGGPPRIHGRSRARPEELQQQADQIAKELSTRP